MLLAPALVVTALVVAFGFVVAPSDDAENAAGTTRDNPPTSTPPPSRSSASAAPSALETPGGVPQANVRRDQLTGPRVTLELKPKPKFTVYDGYDFTIGSFNVLGDSHTRPGGNR